MFSFLRKLHQNRFRGFQANSFFFISSLKWKEKKTEIILGPSDNKAISAQLEF